MRKPSGILSSIAALALVIQPRGAFPADPAPATTPSTTSSTGKPSLPTVTVEAQRKLNREVNHYVTAVEVRYLHDSLLRWNAKICPLVAGLTRERGEFVLTRISQNAAAARAPLAGERCAPNFFVVVTPDPDLLLTKWWRQDQRMFNMNNGMGSVNRFLQSQRPIRVWYNASFKSADGAPLSTGTFDSGLYGSGVSMSYNVPTNPMPDDTRLRHNAVQVLNSVIVIVDEKRVQDLNVGQLADYVSMVGLAEIQLDAELGDTPSILSLFKASKEPPQGLSSWDQAFLYSLYNTNQASVMQTSMIETGMLKQIASPK
jgi:hypothetical protein